MYVVRSDTRHVVRTYEKADDDDSKLLHEARWSRPPASDHCDWWGNIPQEYKDIEGQQWSVSI